VLDEHGFGDYGTRAARAYESGECRQQMQNKDGQIAHRPILPRSREPRNTRGLSNSPGTGYSFWYSRADEHERLALTA
jgi:hypothetical protein